MRSFESSGSFINEIGTKALPVLSLIFSVMTCNTDFDAALRSPSTFDIDEVRINFLNEIAIAAATVTNLIQQEIPSQM